MAIEEDAGLVCGDIPNTNGLIPRRGKQGLALFPTPTKPSYGPFVRGRLVGVAKRLTGPVRAKDQNGSVFPRHGDKAAVGGDGQSDHRPRGLGREPFDLFVARGKVPKQQTAIIMASYQLPRLSGQGAVT